MKKFLIASLISIATVHPFAMGADQFLTTLNQSSGLGPCFFRYGIPIIAGGIAGLGTYWFIQSQNNNSQDDTVALCIAGTAGLGVWGLTRWRQERSYWNWLGKAAQAFLGNQVFDGLKPKNGEEWLLAAAVKAFHENHVNLFEKLVSFENGAVPVETSGFSLLLYIVQYFNPYRHNQNNLKYLIFNRGDGFSQNSFKIGFTLDRFTLLPTILNDPNLINKTIINKFFGGAIDVFVEGLNSWCDLLVCVINPIAQSKGGFVNFQNCKNVINLSYQNRNFINAATNLLASAQSNAGQALVEVLSNTFSEHNTPKENFLYTTFGYALKPEHVGKVVIKFASSPNSKESLNQLMNMCSTRGLWVHKKDFKSALIGAAQNDCCDNIKTLVNAWKGYPDKSFLVSTYSEALAAAVKSGCDKSVRICADYIKSRSQDCTLASQSVLGKALIDAAKYGYKSVVQIMLDINDLIPSQSCIDAATKALENKYQDTFLIIFNECKNLSDELAMKFGQLACQNGLERALQTIMKKVNVSDQKNIATALLQFYKTCDHNPKISLVLQKFIS